MSNDVLDTDTVVETYQDFYGDKVIVWQLDVLDAAKEADSSFCNLHTFVADADYALTARAVQPSADSVTRIDADPNEAPAVVIEELVSGLVDVAPQNIIGYDADE